MRPCPPDVSGPKSPGGSITKASHMQLNASQRSVLHHEATVALFNMSNDRSGFEGQPTKGLRPPHIKQSQGRKIEMRPAALPDPA